MRVEAAIYHVAIPTEDPRGYEPAGVWIVVGGELFAADLPGHSEATNEARALSGRLAGDIPEGFFAYWAERWPTYKGMLSEPEVREYGSVEEALAGELRRAKG